MELEDDDKSPIEIFNRIRHIVMGFLFVAMGVIMIFAEQFKIQQVLTFDKYFRYFFGAICLFYGGFRFYRGIKNFS